MYKLINNIAEHFNSSENLRSCSCLVTASFFIDISCIFVSDCQIYAENTNANLKRSYYGVKISADTGNYEPEITLHLDNFHALKVLKIVCE